MNPVFGTILRICMMLLLALLVVQFALAGFGVGYGGGLEAGFALHFLNGNALLYLYSAAIGFALAARAGAKLVSLTGLGAFLVLLQHGLALVNVPGTLWGQSLFLVHALNGLALIFLAHRTEVLVRNTIRDKSAPRTRDASSSTR
jgi:fucose 4-O-acetylase-like acetyltransferase